MSTPHPVPKKRLLYIIVDAYTFELSLIPLIAAPLSLVGLALTKLCLVRLDISVNRVSRLPLSFVKIQSLRNLTLHDNPMVLPPTNVSLNAIEQRGSLRCIGIVKTYCKL